MKSFGEFERGKISTIPTNERESCDDPCYFIANLPSNFTNQEIEHHLRSLFGRQNPISYTMASRDRKDRPYCFIQFKGSIAEEEILDRRHYLGGRLLRIERARRKTAGTQQPAQIKSIHSTRNPQSRPPRPHAYPLFQQYYTSDHQTSYFPVYVEGASLDEENLFNRFQKYGRIVDIRTSQQDPFYSSAIIYFMDEVGMRDAINGEDGSEWLGFPLRCTPSLEWPTIAEWPYQEPFQLYYPNMGYNQLVHHFYYEPPDHFDQQDEYYNTETTAFLQNNLNLGSKPNLPL